MFFRREKPVQLTFTDHVDNLRNFGFEVQTLGSGKVKAIRRGAAAIIEESGDHLPKIDRAGVVIGNEIAYLVDGGYQKFFSAPDGTKVPALARHLKALHDFDEDLREALGLPSLYNQGLGTTFDQHLYDRVKDRDRGEAPKPWQHRL
jgi:hypothetical protein